MKLNTLFLFLAFLSLNIAPSQRQLPFNKVVLWGYKLHTHTHSYIHYGFFKAFRHLGYETYWFDDGDDVSEFNFKKTLFITVGGQEEYIPLRSDCRYILHNCDSLKYKPLFEQGNCIKLQVYTHDCLARDVKKIDNCMYEDISEKTIYLPWATDLLPEEIDANKKIIKHIKKENCVTWIGSVWGSDQGNYDELLQFVKGCQKWNIVFKQPQQVSPADNVTLIQQSLMAPAIQGKFQCDKGYIPCRIFKNISYGQMGITNSKTVYDLFEGKIIYNADPYQLFFEAYSRLLIPNNNQLYELMDFVKSKHTYINRIETILSFMHKIKAF